MKNRAIMRDSPFSMHSHETTQSDEHEQEKIMAWTLKNVLLFPELLPLRFDNIITLHG